MRATWLGKTLEWKARPDWSESRAGPLWSYHLHYFDELPSAAGNPERSWMGALVDDWIANNPPGTSVAWDSYPISRRLPNWIAWILGSGPAGPGVDESLARQARWLMRRLEHHLLANHIFANAKALAFAGLFFEGPQAERWLQRGARLLLRELEEQILPDGGHYERSPMYHAIVLSDCLDLWNLDRTAGFPEGFADVRESLAQRIPLMLDWISGMSHPDGRISFFHDAACGMAPRPAEILDYANRLGLSPADRSAPELTSSGYALIRSRDGHSRLLFDAGPPGPSYQPGHAHCSLLSFELSRAGRRIFVNSGTSTYERGEERMRQRGTAAHNTLILNGTEQSEIWASHRLGRRAAPLDSGQGRGWVEAAHDGYIRFSGQPMHRRRVTLDDDAFLVLDRVEGSGSHQAEIFFHLHPGLDFLETEDGFNLVAEGKVIGRVELEGPAEARLESSTWHPGFGLSMDNRRLVLSWRGSLPLEQLFRLVWVGRRSAG